MRNEGDKNFGEKLLMYLFVEENFEFEIVNDIDWEKCLKKKEKIKNENRGGFFNFLIFICIF